MDSDEAKLKANDALLARFRDALHLKLVEGMPEPVYGFNPDGWMLFRVKSDPQILGPSEYVAVRRETGEVRFLGALGQ